MIENRDYSGEDFSNETEMPERLERARFTDCRFNSLSFAETKLDRCIFENCSFDFTKLCGVIDGCAFLNCTFRFANLLGTDFIGCKMTGSDLSQPSDPGFSIEGGDWSYTLVSKLVIKKRDLGKVNFTGANLFDCRFENCRLSGVKFDNAVINKLSLRNSDIREASFAMVNLAQIDFKGCIADLDFCVTFAKAAGIKVK